MVATLRSAGVPATQQEASTDSPAPRRHARGWHCLGLAADYRDGKAHSLAAFGTRLVVFQGQSGGLHVLDAWCPHMGADLALGDICGDAIACRFHGWRWGADGRCEAIPYARTIPPAARIRKWPSCEQNKLLFVWHDAEGGEPGADVAIPRIDAVFSGEWTDWSIVRWTIHNNCRELVDNVADIAHFGPVHGGGAIAYFANIFEGHKATQIMVGMFEAAGGTDDYLTTIATYFGPAYQITRMYGATQGVPVQSLLLNAHVPIDHDSFELRFGVMVRKIPGMSDAQCAQMVQGYVDGVTKGFSEDVAIWHNKVRVDRPLLCDGDGPIALNRRWHAQFYMDAADVPAASRERRVVEIDRGLKDKPPLAHAFES